jgi:endonuclease/exonuclease/phosphatase family metal-dependent hydrolase
MTQIKLATFNTEWLALAFITGGWTNWAGNLLAAYPGGSLGGGRHGAIADVPDMCQRVAGVIRDTGAQIIGLEEAAPLKAMMELFVAQFLNNDYVVFHSNPNAQSICALVHRSIAPQVSAWKPDVPDHTNYWKDIPYYPWGTIKSGDRKAHKMARKPLLLRYEPQPGKELRMVVLHTKSKISKLKTRMQWDLREPAAVLDALNARAKLSAELFSLRQLFNRQFELGGTQQSLVLMGDFNDGPAAELMEREFMVHNILDELAGSLLYPQGYFHHAMTPQILRTAKSTHFSDPLEGGAMVEELIDHILVSHAVYEGAADFHLVADSCQVETQAYQNHFDPAQGEKKRQFRPSDHKPVSAVFDF